MSDPSPPDPLAGQRVGEFQITEKLARGGMGSVYAAVHPVIGKRAAIKVLHAELCSNAQATKRFVDEARAVNQIGHPNIVDIFAFGVLNDQRSYFIMEWLEGETLSHRITRGRPPFEEAIDILKQLCAALEAAHEKGIIHRDVKPDNVQLIPSKNGPAVKLLDFGIAKLGVREERTTGPRVAIGTPDYISPEQACAEEVDVKTDVYSLGVLAYELFTGRRPFYGDVRAVMNQHVTKPPPPPHEVWPEIPPALERLILRTLEKSAAERPSIREVYLALEDIGRIGGFGPDSTPEYLSRRPALCRSYGSLAQLARPLITELSSGLVWTQAPGDVPGAGAPVTVRYEVEDLGLRLDFGAVVERQLAAEGAGRTLVRFDRVPKSRLDQIFGLGTALASTDNAPGAPAAEVWRPAGALRPRQAGGEPAPGSLTNTLNTLAVVPSQRPSVASTSGQRAHARPDADDALLPVDTSSEAAKPSFGLGLRIVVLATVVAMLAVVAVTMIALVRVREDRRFYTDGLLVETSRQVSNTLVERRRAWREVLTLVAANEGSLRLLADDFERLGRCDDRGCRAIKGEALPAELPKEFGPNDSGLMIRKLGEDVVLAIRREGVLAVGTMPAESLVKNRQLPAGFGLYVAHHRAGLLASRREDATWPVADLWGPSGPTGTGATQATIDGRPMLVGWSSDGELSVVMTTEVETLNRTVRALAEGLAGVVGAVLLAAVLLAWVFGRRMTRRLRRLTAQASDVGRGEFREISLAGGRDEVGHLAETFNRMTSQLQERDDEVLRIRQKLGEEEARSLQEDLSEWLEGDLSIALDNMNEALAHEAPQTERLKSLVGQANQALQNAFSRAAIASRRVDFASTVKDAVRYVQVRMARPDIDVRFSAPNAVLFPRVPAQESQIRELVDALLRAAASRAKGAGSIEVSLYQINDVLHLSTEYLFGDQSESVARQGLLSAEALLISLHTGVSLERSGRGVASVLRFDGEAE